MHLLGALFHSLNSHRERRFAMARQRTRGSWISRLLGFSSEKKRPVRLAPRRKLHAELLENRMVLSTAPLADIEGPSLADYLAQEHAMGPVAPAEIAVADADAVVAPESTLAV